jgi:hypothetical protein
LKIFFRYSEDVQKCSIRNVQFSMLNDKKGMAP